MIKLFTLVVFYLDWISCPLPSADLRQQRQQSEPARIHLRLAEQLLRHQPFVGQTPGNTVCYNKKEILILSNVY
jgi:hypothetical protein